MAPKSNTLYRACEACKQDIRERMAEPVPLQLRNAPTSLIEELDYGKGYEYAHNLEHKLSKMQCLPDGLKDRVYYEPTNEGEEEYIAKRLEQIKVWKDF